MKNLLRKIYLDHLLRKSSLNTVSIHFKFTQNLT